MRIGCERRCRIELPDGALADRKRALLIAMRRLRPSESGAIQARHGEDLSACQSRPGDLDLRRGDPACHRETLAARIGARQRGDLLRECGVKAGGPANPCRTALREEAPCLRASSDHGYSGRWPGSLHALLR